MIKETYVIAMPYPKHDKLPDILEEDDGTWEEDKDTLDDEDFDEDEEDIDEEEEN